MSEDAPTLGLIIAAGGTGSRFGGEHGKQLACLFGRTVLAWSFSAFASLPALSAVVLVADPTRLAAYAEQISPIVPDGASFTAVAGGETRQESVESGLAALPLSCELIAVHDGARPLLTVEVAASAVAALVDEPDAQGIVVGHPAVDTLKHVSDGEVVATPDRTIFWAVQTPQVFRAAALRHAYERARVDGFLGTDDASLVERLGGRVLVLEGPRDNMKVTHAEDLLIAEAVLTSRCGSEATR